MLPLLPVLTGRSNLSRRAVIPLLSRRPVLTGRTLLVFPKLGDDTPIPCEVRWSTPWGATTAVLPGFGVRFRSLTAKQKAALDKLLETPRR